MIIKTLKKEIIDLVKYPLPLNGELFGKYSDIKRYNNPILELQRLNSNKNFQFSLVLWIFIEEYCPKNEFCAIYQRFDQDSRRFTPNIFLTRNGQVHIEVFDRYNVPTGGMTVEKVPLNDWCRMVFLFRSFKVKIFVN